ncbi:MAG: ferritin [Eubacteriales bacterium]|nr:ferritin [Eubacteriales bacterium]
MRLHQLLNEQINKEMYSAYLYLEISNYYNDKGLAGFANWYRVQAKEEMAHAELFISYMQHIDLKITLEAIAKPNCNLTDNRSGIALALEHEKFVTSSINEIYGEAWDNKDFRTVEFLNWFVKEQTEEEHNASDILNKYDLFGGDPKALYLLDQELAARVFTAPSLVI